MMIIVLILLVVIVLILVLLRSKITECESMEEVITSLKNDLHYQEVKNEQMETSISRLKKLASRSYRCNKCGKYIPKGKEIWVRNKPCHRECQKRGKQ